MSRNMRLHIVAILVALVALTRAGEVRRQVAGQTCVQQDIVFMVDSSSYIGAQHFTEQLEFIKQNIQHYNLDPQCTRISIVTYSSDAYSQFNLNSYSSQQELFNAIDSIQYQPGESHTYNAINYVYTNSFTAANGGRTGVPHYAVLVTGSTSSNAAMTISAASSAQDSGVTFYTVGVGKGVTNGELNGVASSQKNQFSSESYNALSSVAGPLATRINGAVTASSSSQSGGGDSNSCLQKADIVFLVDGSGSIGSANFAKLENFIKGIVGKLDVGQDKVHVGLVEFSNYPQQQFPLDMYTSQQEVLTGIDQMPYMGGGTNTADGIRYVHESMFTTAGGARTNVPRIAVVITDGQSSNPSATASQANSARQDNIGLLAVGVGNGVDSAELNSIADDPDSENTFEVASYDQLGQIATQIINRACAVQATVAPPTALAAGATMAPETCYDNNTECQKYGDNTCQDYFLWAKDNCQRYCGFCEPVYPDVPPPCVDVLANCHEYQPDSCVGDFQEWATDNCRKYCGYCDATAQSVGFYGKCYYKGVEYSQGEKWDDGCDYECTCMNATSGSYQCYNKCPVYYDLPSACTLVKSDTECCLQPVCDFQANITSFQTTSYAQTTDGIDVCDYNGKQYYQGQTWQDGCNYLCTCEDASTGRYKCQTLCASYGSLPNYCHLTKETGECCAKPVCEFQTQQGSFSGSGTVSGQGIGTGPTVAPACMDNLDDCDAYGKTACVNYQPWAKDNCRRYCDLCDGQEPTPTATDVCLYEGSQFHQGESWKVGCDTTCTCENAIYGYYRCVNSCPKYNNIPATCQEVKNDGDCCTSVQCTSGTGTFISSTGNLATIGNGGLISGPDQLTPTLPSGGTPEPGTGGTGNNAPSLSGCLYKGQMYSEGQMWEDGCEYTCQCEDGSQGLYSCRQKCADFPNLPSECVLEVDPEDPCCMTPTCHFTGTPEPVIPVYQQSVTGHNSVAPPDPNELYQGTQTVKYSFTVDGAVTPPTANPNITGGIGHCMYHDQQYAQAEQWQDGCDYNCVCEDATIGFYRCVDRCRKYPDLPDVCTLVTDPDDTCCSIPSCNIPGSVDSITNQGQRTTQPTPVVTAKPTPAATTTPKPKPNVCVFQGEEYAQGQKWFDGCDRTCVCNDATSGVYTCSPRCAEYFEVPAGCTFVPDPNDPVCCQVPQCVPTPLPGSTISPDAIPTIPPGTHFSQPNVTGLIGYCEYNGVHYLTGETWEDGCDYNCVCENEENGRYECTEKCPSYGALPAQCKMVADFTNPCCKKPDCDFTGTLNQITGTLTPAPGPDHTGGPSIAPTQSPTPQYCVYNNAQYSQGQTWNDACQYRCRCEDAARGLYVCDNRCPTYENIPAVCTMVTDPDDSCCTMPKCSFTGTTGEITGTLAPNMIPTQVPGIITGQANTPAPTPGTDGSTAAPQPLSYCEYKEAQYGQDATWDDGCDYTCVCVDATLGKYKCTEKCPKYENIPDECYMIKDAANPCCFKPLCDFTPTTGEITGQGTGSNPTPGTGSTLAPGLNPTPAPKATQAPLPKEVCVYRSTEYTQGQEWYDGCDFKCNCEDAVQGMYRCNQRCASYDSVPADCTLVADPADPLCCKVPQCPIDTNSSNPFPTLPPGQVTGGSVTLSPTPGTTVAPVPGVTPVPGATDAPTPAPKAVCIYKGREYSEGQKWRDGCDYNCVCEDGMAGMYQCTEICPKYPNLPPECTLVQDFNEPCCQKPSCDFTGTTGEHTGQATPVPIPGASTLVPSPGTQTTQAPTPKQYCSYNGVMFQQGDRWDDGCDLQCVCEDDTTGYYRCNQRCASYPSIPDGCSLGTDPNDPCCRVPVCTSTPTPAPKTHTTLAPDYTGPTMVHTIVPTYATGVPTLAPPVINGQGVTPTPMPGVSTVSPPLPVCVYNGAAYRQGDTWQDGCQYNCECVDAVSGQYRCVQRCPVYTSVPSNCRLVTSQTDACCKEAVCTDPTPAPKVTNAPNLGPTTASPPAGSTLTPVPGAPTSKPNMPTPSHGDGTLAPQPQQMCVMNGRGYVQGQTWDDGCDQICACDDASTGHYTCKPRCKQYASIPAECTMVADPDDPICCQVPQCIPVPGTDGNPTPNPTDVPQVYTNAPHAVVTGTGTPLTPTPGTTLVPQPGVTTAVPTPAPEVCVYKGSQYMKGQRWQDGCDYDCVCDDGITGAYTCTARCGDYPNLPRQCQLQRDTNDYCCYVPVCDWVPTPAPQLGLSTVSPVPGQPTTTLAPTPPTRSFCVYNGAYFSQGQTITDGCSQKCRCDDASTNYYNCFDRCASYPQILDGCVMVTDPDDSCCQIPDCPVTPTPAPNMTPSPGTTVAPVTLGPGETLAPGQTLPPTPGPVVTAAPVPTNAPGQIVNHPDPTRPTSQRGFCVYNGQKYTTGQTWDDGCNYKCECLDDMTGQYKCIERCPSYPTLNGCTLVEDPADKCCKICAFTPTPAPSLTQAPDPNATPMSPDGTQVPGLNPTPAPGVNPTPNPSVTTTQAPQPREVCIMNNKAYTQGQTWYDDCDQICVCDDASTGLYTCNQRCSTFNNVDPTCVMVPDPNDPTCCQIPQCTPANSTIPEPVIGTHTGGSVPTPRPGTTVAPIPGQQTPSMTASPTPGVTLAPGMTAEPGATPSIGRTYAPGVTGAPTLAPTPAPPQICVYKGSQYSQGQSWRDGCDYDCTCTDAENGKYTCTDICPRYPGLSVQCTLVRDPANPCCQKPDCSTPAPQPAVTPSPVPGASTQAPSPTPEPKTSFCVYNSIPLRSGEVFNDGCDKVCRCEDTMSNSVVCDDRCPTYPALSAGCTMVTDANDACCQVPQCTPVSPDNNSTVVPGVPGGSITGSTEPGTNTPITGTRDVCLYGGKAYTTGQTWDDGCTYQCECIDGMSGTYRCTERCTQYKNVPAQCSMVQDPDDVCCQKPVCFQPTPAPNMTPAPSPNPSQTMTPNPQGVNTPVTVPGQTAVPTPGGTSAPTPAPQIMVCTYKNQLYRQDQVWYDDCNAICKCEDASTGYYRCQERCAQYPSIPDGCTMVPDPKDPTCCQVAECPLAPTAVPSPSPGYVSPNPNTPAPPEVTGLAPVPTTAQPPVTPSPLPGQTPAPTQAPQPKTGCYYNGRIYQKGEQFDDGCDYNCVCIDDMTGQYSCTKRCTDYPQVLPQECVMVQDPDDACCQKPYCDYSPTPFPDGIPTPAPDPYATPVPGATTLAPGLTPTPATVPPAGYCVYKGVYYTQGQTWDDGCDQTCRCDDVSTGYYSCSVRCPVYDNLPSTCTLITDPDDSCCLAPDCNTFTTHAPIYYQPGTNPTVPGASPSSTTTPQPIIIAPSPLPPAVITGTSSNNPGTGTGTSGTSNMCVYKGTVYTQGQTWDDGCDYQCECFDMTRGQYKCTERCPRYVNLPSYCTYSEDPKDKCCKVASCDTSLIPTPQPQTPTPGPNTATTVAPGITTVGPTGTNVPTMTVAPGMNTGITGTNVSPGMNTGITGTNVPPMTVSPGMNTGITGTNVSPGMNTGITGTNVPPMTVSPGMNTGPSGSNLPATPTSITGNRDKCIYKDNSVHALNTVWKDACDECTCQDPTTNMYKCSNNCPVYSDIPSSCYLTEDPNDPCCKLPECSGTLTPVTVTGTQTTGPSGTNVVPIGTHSSFSGSGRPDSLPGYTTSGLRSVCVYKGTVHQQGESWDDGCDFTCTCQDASQGLYKCTSKCPSYPSSIPSYCKMSAVPGKCCKAMSCNIPQIGNYNPSPELVPTPAPSAAPGGATPTPNSGSVIYPNGNQPVIGGGTKYPGGGYALPPGESVSGIRNQCVFKDRLYNQGETWEDGCDYNCECLDASTGYYECKPRCPSYTLPDKCYTVKASGQCCDQPVCMKPDGTEFNPVTNPDPQYPVYGTYGTGIGGFRPGYNPSTGGTSGTSGTSGSTSVVSGAANQCVYKGRTYTQGQTWDDGCDYACECSDASRGMYTCTPICVTYTSLPASCHMVTLPGQCCQEPQCTQAATTTIRSPVTHINPTIGGCADAIDNCAAYGQSSCSAPYVEWATKNCEAFCGFCTTPTGASAGCVDKLDNCDAYEQSACTGAYEPWAQDNCKKTCNLCTTTTAPYTTVAPSLPSGGCVDVLDNCASYDKSTACEAPYEQWAIDNCRLTCNKCSATGNYGTTVSGSMPDRNWMILLKGVAGAPGDLYTLWNSTRIQNENIPEAMYLTSQYPGHYKPDTSNYWSTLCISKVKVAIYNNGVEKANIVFDAAGADKNNWFDPARIISSTWTDISSAPANLFQFLADPASGREFVAVNSGSGCNVVGWIFVSTQNNCAFEQSTDKPAFYYAPGQHAVNFQTTPPSSGDVIAILAHPDSNCVNPTNSPNSITATSSFCIYTNNQIYRQGETWQDGCNLNCTCEDATVGRYRCIDICPVWNNIPANCTEEKINGQCCSSLNCPYGVVDGSQTDTCVYKGQAHAEGSTWKDGCDYLCECVDGKTGQYRCDALCLSWNLPSQCHFDPAPAGKCCEVPVCPANIQLQYPAGYVAQ